MSIPRQMTLLVGLLVMAGSASAGDGIPGYRQVDLARDLDPQTLGRYQAESKQPRSPGATGGMATLEKTNWWPLGFLAFWNRGSVEMMPGQNGQIYYLVSRTRGYGPLSLIYVSREDSTYDATGTLLTAISTNSSVLGHLTLSQRIRSRLDSGTWTDHWTAHVLHHLFSVADINGKVSVSLLSAPNPASLIEITYPTRRVQHDEVTK